MFKKIMSSFRTVRFATQPVGHFVDRHRAHCWRHFCALVTLLAIWPAVAQNVQEPLDLDTREMVVRVPVAVKDAFGKDTAGELVVTTVRPAGDGPFPLVVISHGRDSEGRAQMTRPRFDSAARYFVRKGFAVAVPMRLGYGELAALGDPEDSMSCDNPRYGPAVEAAARQVMAVVHHLQAQPHIDPSRLLLVGQSVGGFTTVAATALRPAGLVASVNFAGGHGGNPKTRPGDPCKAYLIERTMSQLGSTAQAPMLWLYTENDQYFNPRNSRAWHEAFVKAGGKAEYQLLPAFGEDGHQLFSRGADTWQPLLDEFLARHGFRQPGRLTRPAPTSFARVDDASALPGASERVRSDEYPKYLAARTPKAWAFGAGGRFGWAVGDDALSRALALCQRRTGLACRLYAVDSDVVWTP